jgi:hypothetical protein
MWLASRSTQQFVYDAAKAVAMKYLKGDQISAKFKPLVNLDEDFESYCNYLESQNIPSLREFGYTSKGAA